MFTSPRGGNLHPSVLNKSSALSQASLPSSLSPTFNSGLPTGNGTALSPLRETGTAPEIDEAEARMRAREILQDFARQKNKTADVEQQLQRALQDNERLTHMAEEHRVQLQIEREKHQRELAAARAGSGEIESRIRAANDEVQRVAKAAAQRASDSAANLRLKEQEIDSLEDQLIAAREETHKLRAELHALRQAERVPDEVARAQQKVVELARKLLESERAKGAIERELITDRKHQHQATQTIEALRRQLAEADGKVAAVERAREKDRADFQRTLEQVHHEMEMQRQMYKQFVEQLSNGNFSSSSSIGGSGGDSGTSLHAAVFETRLQGAHEAMELLKRQLAAVTQEAQTANQDLLAERARRIEEVGAARLEQQQLELRREEDAKRLEAALATAAKEHDQLVQLVGVHDVTKRELESYVNKFARAQQQLRELESIQEQLTVELQALKDESHASNAAVALLNDALKNRVNSEARIREMQILHHHEKELLRLQLAPKSASAGASPPSQAASASASAAAAAASAEEIERLTHKLKLLEGERDRLQAEKVSAAQVNESERGALAAELRAAKEAIEGAKVENAQLRSHALHAQREVEEWRSAFHMSERAKHKVHQQLEQMREEVSAGMQDRSSVETRLQLLSQHVHRLESQADRDMQELFRLRRELANAEVAMARREVDYKAEEVARAMSARPEGAAAQLERERELMRLRADKDRVERELQHKEATAQQLHETQLRALSRSAAHGSTMLDMSPFTPGRVSPSPLRPSAPAAPSLPPQPQRLSAGGFASSAAAPASASASATAAVAAGIDSATIGELMRAATPVGKTESRSPPPPS